MQQLSQAIREMIKEKSDLCEYFAESGNRPQNVVQEDEPEKRFKDYPKTQELLRLKAKLIQDRAHPAVHLKVDIFKLDFTQLPQFDIVLIDPPWEEYKKRVVNILSVPQTEKMDTLSYEEIKNLPIDKLAANPSFIFLWVGSEHLDHGRMLFKSWGVKRCEDVVWIKSNINSSKYNPSHADDQSALKRTKEHCLVGIKGDQKKASLPSFIHPNIDTDVILTEEFEIGSLEKPEEIYDIIERFCLGRKKVELFGNDKIKRKGWLKIGKDVETSNFNLETYMKWFEGEVKLDGYVGGTLMGTTSEIESLRPKSPPKQNN